MQNLTYQDEQITYQMSKYLQQTKRYTISKLGYELKDFISYERKFENGIFVKKRIIKNKEKKNATPQGCTFNNKSRWMINRLIVLGEQSVVTIVACKRGFKRGWGCRSVAERAVRSPSGCPERGDYLSRRINQFEICSHATDRAVERAHRFFLPLRSFHHQPMFQT